jgi:excisionase family DNA binding protein
MKDRFLYSISETAELLGCGKTKVYELIHERKLQLVHIGRKSLIPSDSIQDFLRSIGAEK